MKPKTKLDIKYSCISIIDAFITLGFFFSTCDNVIQNLPEGLKGLFFLILYSSICLLSCAIRNFYLLKRYYKEIEQLKERNKKVCKKKECPVYLLPLFAVISCFLSICILF